MAPNKTAEQHGDASVPTQVTLAASQNEIRIDWADGHQSAYPYWYLRGYCPCAVCQGHGGANAFVNEVADTTLEEVFEVGHYALNLVWQDGHRTGIYALSTLRRLCPCASCITAEGSLHPWHGLPANRRTNA